MMPNIQVVQKHWLHFDIHAQNFILFVVIDYKIVMWFLLLNVLASAHTVSGDRHIEEVDEGRKRAIKVIDTGFRISPCPHTIMVRCNIICVHSISSSTKTISGLRVGCFNVQSVQLNCEKRTEMSTFMSPTNTHSVYD